MRILVGTIKMSQFAPDLPFPALSDPPLPGLSSPSPPPSDPSVRDLVASFVLQHSDTIRYIARTKLTAGTRSVFDSEDVLGSVLRRLDGMAERGDLRPRSEGELWALITAIARNTAVSKTRLIERTRALLARDGPCAHELLMRLNRCEGDDQAAALVARMARSLDSSSDRQILLLILRGASAAAIASLLGITEAAASQRWAKIKRALADRFARGLIDG